jgi:glucose/mannose transport system permease protein
MLVFIYGFIGFTGYAPLSNWKSLKLDFTFGGWKLFSPVPEPAVYHVP